MNFSIKPQYTHIIVVYHLNPVAKLLILSIERPDLLITFFKSEYNFLRTKLLHSLFLYSFFRVTGAGSDYKELTVVHSG